jgi:hypothetical protein
MLNEVAYRPTQRMRAGGKAPRILNLSTRRRQVVARSSRSTAIELRSYRLYIILGVVLWIQKVSGVPATGQ